tara:strand:- start:252 stop:380 length:129 start_codon:yes stop_codon:yes gene_type:complete
MCRRKLFVLALIESLSNVGVVILSEDEVIRRLPLPLLAPEEL